MAEKIDKTKKCRRKISKRVPHDMVAEAVGKPIATVKAIRLGDRSQDTDLGQRVMVAEMLLEEGQNKLLQEVKRIVQIPA